MRRIAWLVVLLLTPAAAGAQAVQSATLRRAVQAYENLDFRQTITLAQRSLAERLTAGDRARAYELLGFAYSGIDSLLRAVDAFKQLIVLDPDRQLDPRRISPKVTSSFQLALAQVLVIRGLAVDSAEFVAGQGFVPVRYTVTSPARVRVRAVSGRTTVLVDSSVATGLVNLRWTAQLPNGDPVPAGDYLIVVEATAGQNSFSASRRVRVTRGAVDTLPHLTSLPGYQELPETEIPPSSWRPVGLALVYTGIAVAGTAALNNRDLGSQSWREALAVGAGAVTVGVVINLRKPAPQPARANILYNRLLREQLARRNADIAQQNVARRQQVELSVAPLPAAGGGR